MRCPKIFLKLLPGLVLVLALSESSSADPIVVQDSLFAGAVSLEGEYVLERCTFLGRLDIRSWTRFTIRNCIFEDGVLITGRVADGLFLNNTVVGAGSAGIDLRGYGTLQVINNIVYDNGTGISDAVAGALTLSHNDVFGNRTEYFNCSPDDESISVDPLFRNYRSKDYRLAEGSPCIDRGSPAYRDIDGSRSDIGALPFGAEETESFALLAPADGIVIPQGEVQLRWEPVPYARYYIVSLWTARRESPPLTAQYAALVLDPFELDIEAEEGTRVFWRVSANTSSGAVESAETFSFVIGEPGSVNPSILYPLSFSLSAYPNPFNSSTTISFSLPRPGKYALDIVDMNGRLITRLSEGWREAGKYREVWEANNIANGLLFIRLNGEYSSIMTSVLVLK